MADQLFKAGVFAREFLRPLLIFESLRDRSSAASISAKRLVNFSMCGRRSILDHWQKKDRPQVRRHRGRLSVKKLFLFLFPCWSGGGLGGLGLGHALLELVHAAGGIDKLLRARVEGMARVADTDENGRPGGTRLDHVAAGATDFGILVFRMSFSFHKKRAQQSASSERPLTSSNIEPAADQSGKILTQRY